MVKICDAQETAVVIVLLSDLLSPVARNRVQEALQICCLLLPPANRRKLHLLLRLMNKMANNEELVIDGEQTTRDLV